MIKRVNPKILKTLKKKHSILILGPRGTGKTVFLSKQLSEIPVHRTLNLLDRSEFRRYLNNPALLFDEIQEDVRREKSKQLFYVIDEVQLLPELLYEVHRLHDSYREQVTFVLTGSSARKLKMAEADLLASRAITAKFFPFHSAEIDYQANLKKLLIYGALPEIHSASDSWIKQEKLNTYVGTYLEEEIKKETNVRNIAGFSRFLEYAAAMNGKSVNFSKVAKMAGVSGPTVKEYFQILLDTMLVLELPAWTNSPKKKVQIASKFYFFDTGVLNAITGQISSELSEATYLFGNLFESLVINEFSRQIYLMESPLKIYHYREERGAEVDLILQKNPLSAPIAVEIKSASAPQLEDVANLDRFLDDHPKATAYVLCRTRNPYKQGRITFLNFIDGMKELIALA